MKKLFYFLLVTLFLGCKAEKTTYEEMKSDKMLPEHFTNNELKDLAKIVDFFESEIKSEVENTKSNIDLYKTFLKKDSTLYSKGELNYFIDFKKQKQLYSKLDSSLVYKIWQHPVTIKDTIPIKESLYISCFGDYLRFLKTADKKSSKYKLFKKYAESTELSCGVSITNSVDLLMNYKLYDFKDIKTRLLYAIHYLSVNEEIIQPQIKK